MISNKIFIKSQLTLIHGNHGIGKSTFAIDLVYRAMRNETCPVAIFSYSVYYSDIGLRLLSLAADISPGLYKERKFSEDQLILISNAIAEISRAAIFIHDHENFFSLEDIQREIREMHFKHGPGIVIIDYLQVISLSDFQGRSEEIIKILTTLKNLTLELEMTIILMAQKMRITKKVNDTCDVVAYMTKDCDGKSILELKEKKVQLLWNAKLCSLSIIDEC